MTSYKRYPIPKFGEWDPDSTAKETEPLPKSNFNYYTIDDPEETSIEEGEYELEFDQKSNKKCSFLFISIAFMIGIGSTMILLNKHFSFFGRARTGIVPPASSFLGKGIYEVSGPSQLVHMDTGERIEFKQFPGTKQPFDLSAQAQAKLSSRRRALEADVFYKPRGYTSNVIESNIESTPPCRGYGSASPIGYEVMYRSPPIGYDVMYHSPPIGYQVMHRSPPIGYEVMYRSPVYKSHPGYMSQFKAIEEALNSPDKTPEKTPEKISKEKEAEYELIRAASTNLADEHLIAERYSVIVDESKGGIDLHGKMVPTKFNELISTPNELFKHEYIFDIPYKVAEYFFKDESLDANVAAALKQKIESVKSSYVQPMEELSQDEKQFLPMNCNDLSFYEPSSEFIFNTKVYMPDTKTAFHAGCNSKISKLTAKALQYIEFKQNTNCESTDNSNFFYPVQAYHGVGAQLTFMSVAMAYALDHNYKYITPEIPKVHAENSINKFADIGCHMQTDETKGQSVNYDCFVEPLTTCKNYDVSKYQDWLKQEESHFSITSKTEPSEAAYVMSRPHLKRPKEFEGLGEMWWQSVLLSYITRPNRRIQNKIRSFKTQNDWDKKRNEGIISVHIRHGDVCGKEQRWFRGCGTLEEYLTYINKLHDIYGYKNIYLATDDASVINEAKVMNEDPKNKYNFIYRDMERGMYDSEDWIEFRKDVNYADMYDDAIIDALLMSEGKAFVGKFSSNLSRIVYSLMVANSGGFKPFASLDTSWCMADRGSFPCW